MAHPNKVLKLGIRILPVIIIGLLVISNISLSLAAPAIGNDDSDSSTPSQSSFASHSNKNSTRINPWEPVIFNTPVTGNNEIIPSSTICNQVFGLRIYKDSVLSIKLRGPPLGVDFFG